MRIQHLQYIHDGRQYKQQYDIQYVNQQTFDFVPNLDSFTLHCHCKFDNTAQRTCGVHHVPCRGCVAGGGPVSAKTLLLECVHSSD